MTAISGKQFLDYARRLPERWKELEGRKLSHPAFGNGRVTRVQVDDRDIVISIDFNEGKIRYFASCVLEFVKEIEFPDIDAHRILTGTPGTKPQSSPYPPRNPSPPPGNTVPDPPDRNRSEPKFAINDDVCLRFKPDKRGIVRKQKWIDRQWYYDVFFSFEDSPTVKEADLEAWTPEMVWGSLDDFLRDLALVKLRQPMSDMLYALHGSRTEFAVYQYKPALKFLANPDQRILIADEVGLGKTIEAGIIFLELQARVDLPRVLIVCPSGLKVKWQEEMKSRFDEEFNILDTESLNRFFNQYALYGENTALRGIVSLELARSKRFAEKFTDVNLDLMILDEAHHCRNTGTLANALAETLAENSDAALLLTATPLQMGKSDLFNLLNILSPGEFDNFEAFGQRLEPNQYINRAAQLLSMGKPTDALKELRKVESTSERARFTGSPYYDEVLSILNTGYPGYQELIRAQRRLLELNTLASVFTRTRKRDIQEKPAIRTAYVLQVRLTREERDFYEQVIDDVRADYKGSGWMSVMKERQAASCLSAALERWKEQHPELDTEEETFENSLYSEEDQAGSVEPAEPKSLRQLRRRCFYAKANKSISLEIPLP